MSRTCVVKPVEHGKRGASVFLARWRSRSLDVVARRGCALKLACRRSLQIKCAPAEVLVVVAPQQAAFVADIAAAAAVQSTRARWLAAVCSTAALRAPKAKRRHPIVIFSGLAGSALSAVCPTWTLRPSSRASDPSPACSTPLLRWGVPLWAN